MTFGRWITFPRGRIFIPEYREPSDEWSWALPRLESLPDGYYRVGPGSEIVRIGGMP